MNTNELKKLLDEYVFVRFWSKVNVLKKHQCWEWQSSLNLSGYGQISIKNKPYLAHRIAYFYFNGKIKSSYVIDHICMNKKCVNPNHLRQVNYKTSNTENTNGAAYINSQKTHCPQGHPYSGKNLVIKNIKNKRTQRRCRSCDKLYKANLYKRQTLTDLEQKLKGG